jgi:hypothetical protein
MTTIHHISHADALMRGTAYYEKYHKDSLIGKRGAPIPAIVAIEFGAVDVLDADGICVNVTSSDAKTLSATGALVSGGVATLDVARCLSITSTANESALTFTLTGTDDYGEALVETLAGPNNTTVYSQKAFKTVTSVAVSGNITSNAVDVGTSKILGLPFRGGSGKLIALTVDGNTSTAAITYTSALSSTAVSTATTADVRGTITLTTAPNGSKYFNALMIVDTSSKTRLFGVDQYGG